MAARDGRRIEVTGRDVIEGEYAVTFDGPRGLWTLDGGSLAAAAAEARQRKATDGLDERASAVIAFIDEHPDGVRWSDVKHMLGDSEARYLSRLAESGRIHADRGALPTPVRCVRSVRFHHRNTHYGHPA